MTNPLPDDAHHLCPLCQSSMELREVTPCMECGADPRELEHARSGLHTFEEVIAFNQFRIVLCDFCQIDFSSYPHHFFGLPMSMHTGFNSLTPVRKVEYSQPEMDYYCQSCGYRNAFLQFVSQVRKHHRETFGDVSS